MSYVTIAMLFFDVQENFEEDLEDRIDHPITHVNEWLESSYNEKLHPFSAEMWNGSVEHNNIWIGAFSHLDTDAMLNIVRAQKWRVEESVELIFKGAEDENLSLFSFPD